MNYKGVMAGLVPAIRVLLSASVKDVDARTSPGMTNLTSDEA